MKKILSIATLIIIIIILDILISRILPFFLRPHIWFIYIIYATLFFNHTISTTLGFISGIIVDFLHLNIFGINTLTLSTIGYVVGWLNKRVNENLYKVQIIVLFFSSVFYILIYIITSTIFNIKVGNIVHFLLAPFNNTIFGFFILKFFIWYYKKWNLI